MLVSIIKNVHVWVCDCLDLCALYMLVCGGKEGMFKYRIWRTLQTTTHTHTTQQHANAGHTPVDASLCQRSPHDCDQYKRWSNTEQHTQLKQHSTVTQLKQHRTAQWAHTAQTTQKSTQLKQHRTAHTANSIEQTARSTDSNILRHAK